MRRYKKGLYRVVVGCGHYPNDDPDYTQVYKDEEFIFATKNEKLALRIMSGLAFLRTQRLVGRTLELEFIGQLELASDCQLQVWEHVAEVMIGFAEDGDYDQILNISVKRKWEERLKDIQEEVESRQK